MQTQENENLKKQLEDLNTRSYEEIKSNFLISKWQLLHNFITHSPKNSVKKRKTLRKKIKQKQNLVKRINCGKEKINCCRDNERDFV